MHNPVIASNTEGEALGVVHDLATYAPIFQRDCFEQYHRDFLDGLFLR